MNRPEKVQDALNFVEDGLCVGTYGDCILHSAYQPIYRLRGDQARYIEAYEGLVRVFRNGEAVDAGQFFAAVPMQDRLFIECMCQAVHIINYRKAVPKNRTLFVNINPATYTSIGMLEKEYGFLLRQFEKYGLNSSIVAFELLETAPYSPYILCWLRDMARNNGIRFAMDDFGDHHSNIERYHVLRPEIVKIDMNYFHLCAKYPSQFRKLKAYMQHFRDDGVITIIEGVEDFSQLDMASELQADMVQGYLMMKPQILPSVFEATTAINAHVAVA